MKIKELEAVSIHTYNGCISDLEIDGIIDEPMYHAIRYLKNGYTGVSIKSRERSTYWIKGNYNNAICYHWDDGIKYNRISCKEFFSYISEYKKTKLIEKVAGI